MANMMVGRNVLFNITKSGKNYRDVVLEVRDLSVKDENKIDVVKHVSFNIRGGEILALRAYPETGRRNLPMLLPV